MFIITWMHKKEKGQGSCYAALGLSNISYVSLAAIYIATVI